MAAWTPRRRADPSRRVPSVRERRDAERVAGARRGSVDAHDVTLLAEAQARVWRTGTEATLVEGDVRDLPFESGRFDLVLDFGTCYHASDTMDGRRAALSEVSRVLCDDGLFVHETRVAQRLAHPVRSFGRMLPWHAVPELAPDRSAVLWGVRRKRKVP
jgi:SAM-dependent methyltransferase